MSRLDSCLEQTLAVLTQRPAALITDIDGTISPIVSRPEDATVSRVIAEALGDLSRRLALVAVVTAREQLVARRMVGADCLTYVGNYASSVAGATALEPGVLKPARLEIAPLLSSLPCVTLEDKSVAFALHYRNCADSDGTRSRLLDLVEPIALRNGARVVEGKQVIELVPREMPSKGTAVAGLIDEYRLRGVIYLGDDLGDIPVFRELARRRQDGLTALGIAVADAETHPAVLEAADVRLDGVPEVEWLLTRLRDTLCTGGL